MSPVVKRETYELKGDQARWPFVWIKFADISEAKRQIDTANATLARAFGPGKARKLKSWGHAGPVGVHWLATRSGTALHTDPAYSRYSHHLIVRNDGFRTRGMDDAPDGFPLLRPGVYYCLDAHSPHEVVLDKRLSTLRLEPALYKLDVTFDTDEPWSPSDALEILAGHLAQDITIGIDDAAKTAPAPRSGARA